jgi:hypothetical protein
MGWFIFTFIMFLASLRSSVALSGVFFFLTITFLLLGAAEFTGSVGVKKAGGWFGLITAFNAWVSSDADHPQKIFFKLFTYAIARSTSLPQASSRQTRASSSCPSAISIAKTEWEEDKTRHVSESGRLQHYTGGLPDFSLSKAFAKVV